MMILKYWFQYFIVIKLVLICDFYSLNYDCYFGYSTIFPENIIQIFLTDEGDLLGHVMML